MDGKCIFLRVQHLYEEKRENVGECIIAVTIPWNGIEETEKFRVFSPSPSSVSSVMVKREKHKDSTA